jgi:cell division protein FtsW (lipid II flippase)
VASKVEYLISCTGFVDWHVLYRCVWMAVLLLNVVVVHLLYTCVNLAFTILKIGMASYQPSTFHKLLLHLAPEGSMDG